MTTSPVQAGQAGTEILSKLNFRPEPDHKIRAFKLHTVHRFTKNRLFEDVYLLEKQSDLPIFKEKYDPNKKNIFICNEKFCLPAVLTTKQALNLEI